MLLEGTQLRISILLQERLGLRVSYLTEKFGDFPATDMIPETKEPRSKT